MLLLVVVIIVVGVGGVGGADTSIARVSDHTRKQRATN